MAKKGMKIEKVAQSYVSMCKHVPYIHKSPKY